MQKRIEQYLNRATRGLWGKKRQDVKTELHSHIYERMHYHMAFGKSEEEALGLALHALGKPAEVSRGLFKLHALPALGKMLVVTGLLSTALVTQAQNGFQLQIVSVPSECAALGCNFPSEDFIKVNDLTQMLHKQMPSARVDHPDHQGLNMITLTMNNWSHDYTYKTINSEKMISIYDFIGSFMNKEGFSINGLFDPQIHYNGLSFHLKSDKGKYDISNFYLYMLKSHVEHDFGRLPLIFNANYHKTYGGTAKKIKPTNAKDGDVYVLLQRPQQQIHMENKTIDAYIYNIAEVKDGIIEFAHVHSGLELTPYISKTSGDVLLKLTGVFEGQPYTAVHVSEEDFF